MSAEPNRPAHPPLLVYQGSVHAWECDENDHLNVRYFVHKAWQGVANLAAAAGLPGAFQNTAASTLAPTDIHIRFLKEARANQGLSVWAGVLSVDECAATVFAEMQHKDGQPAATFAIRLVHVAARTQGAFPWSQRARAALETMRCALPAHARPRSIDVTRAPCRASVAAADTLGARLIGMGAIGAEECDVFGRMRPEMFLGRVSESMPHMSRDVSEGTRDSELGRAVVEYRLAVRALPRAGDLVHIRSGAVGVTEKTRSFVHWMLDPRSGGAWATAEAVAVSLDRRARRAVALTPEQVAEARKTILPAMSI